MSDADDSVIQHLEARRGRARRQAPPRRPARGIPTPPAMANPGSAEDSAPEASEQPESESGDAQATAPPEPTSESTGSARSATPREKGPDETSTVRAHASAGLRLDPDEPVANYAVRVRRSLDDLVAWRLAELRREGIRTTKVELTEMLLWELSSAAPADLKKRLEVFRRHAAR